MKTKNQSLSGTTTSRSTLTYIEQLITGATQEGLFHVYVSAKYIDDGMVTTLRSNGFSVDKINNFLGDNYDYLINWGDDTPTVTPSGITVYSHEFIICCPQDYITLYSSSPSIIVGSYLYSDNSLTVPYETSAVLIVGEYPDTCPSSYDNGITTNSSGLVTNISVSGICD